MDFTTASAVIAFFQSHGYLIVFIIMIFEGPIITYAAAFAASQGIFNPFIILGLAILGNIISDIFYYSVGKIASSSTVFRLVRRFKLTKKGMSQIEAGFKKHPFKSLVIIKLSTLLAIPGLIFAGAVDMPIFTFLFYVLIIGIPSLIALVALGFYSGVAFNIIAQYFKFGGFVIVGFILILWGLWVGVKKLLVLLMKRFHLETIAQPKKRAGVSSRKPPRSS